MKSILIKGGRIMDPATGLDTSGDVLVERGKIVSIGRDESGERSEQTVIPAQGLIVAPGFVDMHCHLREPGFEEKETIASGTRAAARGGFTTVCCMPNTNPPIDDVPGVEYVRNKALAEGAVRVLPIACISQRRAGKALVEMRRLAAAGAIAFSDDGSSVASSQLMRHAMEYSQICGLPLIEHCEDPGLAGHGVMNEGWVASRLGLAGIPAAAEEVIVARDIALAELSGAWLHVAHASTAGTVELIARAKQKGIHVTAEATPHHLALTDERLLDYDTSAKINPPLRSRKDVDALIQGLRTGMIDVIATDHSPHARLDKECEFDLAAFGISGFETALPVLLGLVNEEKIELMTLLARLTSGPAEILRAAASGGASPAGLVPEGLGKLSVGQPADVVVFDPHKSVTIDVASFISKGKNNPWHGLTLQGAVVATLVEGKVAYGGEGCGCRAR